MDGVRAGVEADEAGDLVVDLGDANRAVVNQVPHHVLGGVGETGEATGVGLDGVADLHTARWERGAVKSSRGLPCPWTAVAGVASNRGGAQSASRVAGVPSSRCTASPPGGPVTPTNRHVCPSMNTVIHGDTEATRQ